jgi:hypothetical protein
VRVPEEWPRRAAFQTLGARCAVTSSRHHVVTPLDARMEQDPGLEPMGNSHGCAGYSMTAASAFRR